MISAVDVTKTYKTKDGIITALGGVSCQIETGEYVAVIGRSGTGKSTLLGIMGGLIRPTSGEVFRDGQSIWGLSEREMAKRRAQETGFIFQNASVIPSLTVLENVILSQSFLPELAKADRHRAIELIEMMGLGDRVNAYPDQLSGGQRRRVAIANALMNDPPLLLADEPTGDLDSETEAEIMNLFTELWRSGKTIVMVTHSPQLASVANRTLKMADGCIQETSSQSEILNKESHS